MVFTEFSQGLQLGRDVFCRYTKLEIGKARNTGKEVVLFNMNFPKEFMDLTFYKQPVAFFL